MTGLTLGKLYHLNRLTLISPGPMVGVHSLTGDVMTILTIEQRYPGDCTVQVEFPDGMETCSAFIQDGMLTPEPIDGYTFEAILGGWFAYANVEEYDDGRDFSGKYEP